MLELVASFASGSIGSIWGPMPNMESRAEVQDLEWNRRKELRCPGQGMPWLVEARAT